MGIRYGARSTHYGPKNLGIRLEHPAAITQCFDVRLDESRFLKDEESALLKIWSEIMFSE